MDVFFPHLGYTPVLARVVQAELCSAVLRAQRNVNGLCKVSHSLSTQDATFAQDVLRPQCVPPAWVGEDREASGVSAGSDGVASAPGDEAHALCRPVTVCVMVIGGVVPAEVACFRWMADRFGINVLIATTAVTTGTRMLDSVYSAQPGKP